MGWFGRMRGLVLLVVAAVMGLVRSVCGRDREPEWGLGRRVMASGDRGTTQGGQAAPFWKFVRNEAAADGEPEADLLLYGALGESSWFEDRLSPKQFADELAALGDIKHLRVRINSPGGDVFAGQAIYNLLKTHKAKVTAHIDGLAASAASVVAMAADEVVMPPNAMMMIHNPWSWASGDAREMRKTADVLDQVRETIIAAYQAKSGMDRAQIINLLNSETWLTAQQAKDLNLVDTVADLVKVSACSQSGQFNVNGQVMDFKKFAVWPGALLASADEGSQEPPGDPPAGDGDPAPDADPAPGDGDPAPAGGDPPAGDGGSDPPATPPADPPDPVAEALAAERARMQGIDDLAAGIEGAAGLAFRAKYMEPVSVSEFAVKLLQSPDVKNAGLLALRRNAAGAARVPAGSVGNEADERKVQAQMIVDRMKAMQGTK